MGGWDGNGIPGRAVAGEGWGVAAWAPSVEVEPTGLVDKAVLRRDHEKKRDIEF